MSYDGLSYSNTEHKCTDAGSHPPHSCTWLPLHSHLFFCFKMALLLGLHEGVFTGELGSG